jgi:2-dehydropantoate 2-reductase
MQIKTVSIIGLGALGIMFGNHLSKQMPGRLRIIADRERITRYKNTQIYSNGELCDFCYIDPEENCEPADLLIFAVKYNNLKDAIEEVRNHVGTDTIIISLLNGITSEAVIGQTYGDKVIDCVAQGMDAVKEKNQLTYNNMGLICIGDRNSDIISQKIKTTAEFFDKTKIPYIIDPDMKKRMWGKFMLNVGVNQTVAVYQSNYGEIQRNGPARDLMIAAMREVIVLSEKEGVFLTEDDLNYWLEVLKPLNPAGKPSMRQDLEAKRLSEVELFSGTVLSLGQKYEIYTPVNKELYNRIKEIESKF